MVNYDELASDYARHRQVQAELVERFISGSGIRDASTVLDVGCGTGNYIIAVEAASGCRCWGIDPSEQMLASAPSRTTRVHFELGSAEKLNFSDGFFDFVFSVDVIHHVADRMAYFLEAHRVLKPGGRMCTVTESDWMIRNRRPLANYFPDTVAPEVARYPRIADLRNLLAKTGFIETKEENIEVVYSVNHTQAYRDKAFSSLLLIPESAFQSGIDRMERDLLAGPIQCVSRSLLLWGTKA